MEHRLPQETIRIKQNTYLAPDFRLQQHIAHYTITLPPKADSCRSSSLRLIPDGSGCIVVSITKKEVLCKYWGPTTKIVTVSYQAETVIARVMIEFLPGGSFGLLGCNNQEYVNEQIHLKEIMPDLAESLSSIAFLFSFPDALKKRLDFLFLSLLAKQSVKEKTIRLLPLLQQTPIHVHTLAALTHYSPRHISRLLRPALGMPLSQYIRIVRINQALEALKGYQGTLTQLALDFGYYDQAHFNHEMKEICGVSPTMYQKKLSSFYNETFKF